MELRAATYGHLAAIAALLSLRPEHIRADWELSGFELEHDAWVVASDGRLVGYAAVFADGRLVLSAPEPDAAELLLERARLRGTARGLEALRLTVEAESELVRRHPFVREREILAMSRPLDVPVPAPVWPSGIAVRTFEPADAKAVQAMLDEAYRAWDGRYVPLTHEDWLRWMTGDIDFDPQVWWLAERDGAPVACALHWRTGWLKDLAVRDTERGRGLGAALVNHGLAEFARRGIGRVGLKVDAANPTGAVRLYERLGFTVERREATWALSL